MREWENLVIRPGGHAGRRFAEYVGETVFLSATEKLRCSCRRLPQGTVTVFLTLKQETAGTEPGDDEQAAGKFQQQAGKHPKRRSGTGPEGVHDILSGKDKFRQQRPQERHEQKAYDGGEKEAPRHGADDGSPDAGGSAAEFFGAHASGKLVNDHASRHQQRQDGPFPPRQVFSAHGSLPDAPGRNDDNSGKHGDERADQPHAE
jgi:hypothetical protein